MQIIHHLTIDMVRPLPAVPLDAVQGDGSTRAVKLSLLENGAPWEVPAGVTAAVAFRKADGHRGLYDTLPDGSKAVTIDGSTVTAVIAPQVLSCPGEVSAAVVFYGANLQQLAGVLIHCNNGGLIEHDALTLHKDQNRSGSQVNTNIFRHRHI